MALSGASGPEATEVYTTPPAPGVAGSSAAIPTITNNWLLPADFQAKEILGRGGMGVVLRVHQLSLHRDVAVKVLPRDIAANEMHRELFLREARTCAQLRHPNIVQVYQAGVLLDGSLFFVMELVEGQTLDALVQQVGPLAADKRRGTARAVSDAFRVMFDLCDALQVAHSKGIIHRDIKPQNILIEQDGRARLMDFGIAVLRDESESHLTAAGTPAYMAPEQMGGKQIDHRADLYALGGVLYFLLTGKPPHTGKGLSLVARSSQSSGDAIPQERWEALPSTASPAMRRLLRQMMAVSPAERFASIGDLRVRLEAIYLENTAGSGRTRWFRRKAVLVAAAILMILMVGGAGYLLATRTTSASRAGDEEVDRSRIEHLKQEIALQLQAPELDPRWGALYQGWLQEMEGLQRQGKLTDAVRVGEFAVAQVEMQQIEQVATVLQKLQVPDPAVQQAIAAYVAAVGQAKEHPEERDVAGLRTRGLELLTKANSFPRK